MKNRRALRALRSQDPTTLPAPVLLALADARLRGNNTGAAARYFETVLSRNAGQPWETYAHLGLGGIAFKRGDNAEARTQYETALAAGVSARLMLAFVEADDGHDDDARAHFEALSVDPLTRPGLRAAALLGVAYTRYWSGDYPAAENAFDVASRMISDGNLIDDALYGRARACLRSGDEEGARKLFAAMVARAREPGAIARTGRGLQDLHRSAVLRAGFDRYRRAPPREPGGGGLAADSVG